MTAKWTLEDEMLLKELAAKKDAATRSREQPLMDWAKNIHNTCDGSEDIFYHLRNNAVNLAEALEKYIADGELK